MLSPENGSLPVSETIWGQGHSVEFMALPSNVQSHPSGSSLPFSSLAPPELNFLLSFPAASLYSSPIRTFSRQMFSSISLKFCDSSLVSASRAPLLFRRAVSVSRNILLVLHYTVLRNQVCSPRVVIKFIRQSLFLLVFGPYPPWPSFSPQLSVVLPAEAP